jgi:hypothetical protein
LIGDIDDLQRDIAEKLFNSLIFIIRADPERFLNLALLDRLSLYFFEASSARAILLFNDFLNLMMFSPPYMQKAPPWAGTQENKLVISRLWWCLIESVTLLI